MIQKGLFELINTYLMDEIADEKSLFYQPKCYEEEAK